MFNMKYFGKYKTSVKILTPTCQYFVEVQYYSIHFWKKFSCVVPNLIFAMTKACTLYDGVNFHPHFCNIAVLAEITSYNVSLITQYTGSETTKICKIWQNTKMLQFLSTILTNFNFKNVLKNISLRPSFKYWYFLGVKIFNISNYLNAI